MVAQWQGGSFNGAEEFYTIVGNGSFTAGEREGIMTALRESNVNEHTELEVRQALHLHELNQEEPDIRYRQQNEKSGTIGRYKTDYKEKPVDEFPPLPVSTAKFAWVGSPGGNYVSPPTINRNNFAVNWNNP